MAHLISVLTAAVCCEYMDRPDIPHLTTQISFGDKSQISEYRVRACVMHPEYHKHIRRNNIALIQLDRELPVATEESTYNSICLPEKPLEPAQFEQPLEV